MNQPIRRKDAILAGKLRYFTGFMCRNGHVVERYTSNGACVECVRPASKGIRKRIPSERVVRIAMLVPTGATDDHVTRLSKWINSVCVPAFFKAEYETACKAAGIEVSS